MGGSAGGCDDDEAEAGGAGRRRNQLLAVALLQAQAVLINKCGYAGNAATASYAGVHGMISPHALGACVCEDSIYGSQLRMHACGGR